MRALLGRGLILAVLTFPLYGCWAEQQSAFVSCNTRLPYLGRNPSIDDSAPTRMTQCMAAAGYSTDFHNANCAVVAVPRRSPYCYAPDDFLGLLGYRIEMFFAPAPGPPVTDRL